MTDYHLGFAKFKNWISKNQTKEPVYPPHSPDSKLVVVSKLKKIGVDTEELVNVECQDFGGQRRYVATNRVNRNQIFIWVSGMYDIRELWVLDASGQEVIFLYRNPNGANATDLDHEVGPIMVNFGQQLVEFFEQICRQQEADIK